MSPLREPKQPSSTKGKITKRKLLFGKEGEKSKGLVEGDNPLNLPYSDSELEPEQIEAQGKEQADQIVDDYPNLPTPTPLEEHNTLVAKQFASKTALPRSRKINQLLKKVYDLEYSENQVKKKNAQLLGINLELYDMSQEIKGKNDKTLERNKLVMRDNAKLYIRLRLLRLQMKEPQTPAARHSGMETLANLTTSLKK